MNLFWHHLFRSALPADLLYQAAAWYFAALDAIAIDPMAHLPARSSIVKCSTPFIGWMRIAAYRQQ